MKNFELTRKTPRDNGVVHLSYIHLLFLVSGFPALIYQLIWQRSLFAVFGVNIESVTIVVTVFMLGIGFGALLGGIISKSAGKYSLHLFGLIEIAIGLFGHFSLNLMEWLNRYSLDASQGDVVTLSFIFLLFPTLLMGASFPLLTGFLVRISDNVGRSVGDLYFVNTMGSALACAYGALFLFRWLGQQGSVDLAALLNLMVGLGAFIICMLLRKPKTNAVTSADIKETPIQKNGASLLHLPFAAALLAAGMTGYIALSHEIVWVRVFSFASQGTASSFVLMLCAYLAGLGIGARWSQKFCINKVDQKRVLAVFLYAILFASLLGFIVVPAVGVTVFYGDYWWALPLVALVTSVFGALLPLISHFSISPDKNAGYRLGAIYMANVLGAASGSFVTGFVLMDLWPLKHIVLGLTLLGLVVAFIVLHYMKLARMSLLLAGMVALIWWSVDPLFDNLYERLQEKANYEDGYSFRHTVENRHGVISVTPDGQVYGGGEYDGAFNIDPINDNNGIFRAYGVALLHENPKNVLMVGLSSGSWAKVIAHHPRLEKLTIVEINPGYLEIIAKNPIVASILQNPKVNIIIDDGRRWLSAHPERKFDMVVMNTTQHWRANITNLLSLEFMDLVRSHLDKDGVFYFNTTGSQRVQLNGALSYPYALRFYNFIAVSDAPILANWERFRKTLINYTIDKQQVFNLENPNHRETLELLMQRVDGLHSPTPIPKGVESRERLLSRIPPQPPVTQDNMGLEWSRL